MSLAGGLARQLAAPTGVAGALCGAAMDLVNRAPLRMAVDMLAPQDGERVLDVGCGTGAASEAMLRRADCSVLAVDQSEAMVRRARSRLGRIGDGRRAEVRRTRAEDLPGETGRVDAALALNIFYFCAPDGAMIRAIHDMLAPGGRLVAYVTHRDAMQHWAFVREGLHRLYDEDALREALVTGGFDPARVSIENRAVGAGVMGLFARAYVG